MSLVKKFAGVGSATMASRLLGFVREALIAATLGAGPVTDAFYAAFRFPNLFRRLFAEGAFNTAFIPLFAKELEGGGMEAARKFGEDVLSVLIAALLVLSAGAIIAMPFLVSTVIAPGFSDTPDKFDLTVVMTRIMFPYLFCMSMVAMLSGVLNSMRRYFLAAFVPVLLNIVLILVLLAALRGGMDDRLTGLWLAWGVFLSGVLQLVFLVWGVWREGFSMQLRLPRLTPDVRRLLVLMAPALLTGGVVQINLLVGQIIASAQDNAISLLNFADRINQLPLGVIGVAVGVVLLPELSRALRSGDHADAEHLQNRSLEFALGLTLPAAIGLIAMPGPIVAMLYERGEFTSEATLLTAQALAAFAAGLPAYVLIKVFSPAFFAREDMKTPMWFSIVAVAVNIVASLALFPIYGHVAIALATTVSAWLNLLLLAGTLWMRNDFRPSAVTARRVVLIAVASFAMGVLIWALQMLLAPIMENPSGLIRLAAVLAIIAAGAIAYFAIVIATGAVDRQQLIGIVRRRRSRPIEAGTATPDPE
ncbi:murein biosynthesis integral membrane protein MurJ [Allomesorhizobium camelthorni]|uniref:Probable lipid II flippase MurJ n=1 Tax=Allomesorhizobium camelthorni TaxID=475069 RepID=A0A6G4WAD6_9HYPH|nr:murein biosynthesis integral membrane protein MurJ [Mesorhizobium camelthorni]NGO51173.1 murein biosynthesis integral membrane protein MurJ [Mesorhizobium camelthorni]